VQLCSLTPPPSTAKCTFTQSPPPSYTAPSTSQPGFFSPIAFSNPAVGPFPVEFTGPFLLSGTFDLPWSFPFAEGQSFLLLIPLLLFSPSKGDLFCRYKSLLVSSLVDQPVFRKKSVSFSCFSPSLYIQMCEGQTAVVFSTGIFFPCGRRPLFLASLPDRYKFQLSGLMFSLPTSSIPPPSYPPWNSPRSALFFAPCLIDCSANSFGTGVSSFFRRYSRINVSPIDVLLRPSNLLYAFFESSLTPRDPPPSLLTL